MDPIAGDTPGGREGEAGASGEGQASCFDKLSTSGTSPGAGGGEPAPGTTGGPDQPRRAPGNPLAFFGLLVVLYVGPGALSQMTVPVAGLAWSQIYVFLLPAIAAAAAWNLDPRSALLLSRRPSPAMLLLALLIGLVGFVPAGAVMALVSLALPREWVARFDLAPLFMGPAWQRILLSVVAALVAPVCEETAFRGQLLTLWRARLRPVAAILATAFLFALLHLDPVRFVAVFLLGVLFGWMAWRSGSLWPSIIAHAANNATAASLVGSMGDAATRHEQPDPRAALMALGMGALLVAPLLVAFQRLTPVPQPVSEVLVPLDPSPSAPRTALRRVPASAVSVGVVGLIALLVIVAIGFLRRLH